MIYLIKFLRKSHWASLCVWHRKGFLPSFGIVCYCCYGDCCRCCYSDHLLLLLWWPCAAAAIAMMTICCCCCYGDRLLWWSSAAAAMVTVCNFCYGNHLLLLLLWWHSAAAVMTYTATMVTIHCCSGEIGNDGKIPTKKILLSALPISFMTQFAYFWKLSKENAQMSKTND